MSAHRNRQPVTGEKVRGVRLGGVRASDLQLLGLRTRYATGTSVYIMYQQIYILKYSPLSHLRIVKAYLYYVLKVTKIRKDVSFLPGILAIDSFIGA